MKTARLTAAALAALALTGATAATPEPDLGHGTPSPLATSDDDFVDLTLALKARGAYARDDP